MKTISPIQEYSNFSFDISLIPTEPVSGFSLYFGNTGVSGIFNTGVGFYGTGGMIFDNSGDLFGGYYSGRLVDIQGSLFSNRLSYFCNGTLIKNSLPSSNYFNCIEFDKHGNTGLDLVLNYMANDPDALSYIALVEEAGATVTGEQRVYIDNFYKSAKDTGYYTSLKRLYLPIWGVAAANAIDMITGASGTFNGGITHGAGFVQGNGSTGYFDFGISDIAAGMTVTSGLVGFISYEADTRNDPRTYINSLNVGIEQYGTTNINCLIGRSSSASLTTTANTGVIIGNRNATGQKISQLRAGVLSRSANDPVASDPPAGVNMYAMVWNAGSWHCNAKLGAYFMGTGITSDSSIDALSAHLKTLWEGTTLLILP